VSWTMIKISLADIERNVHVVLKNQFESDFVKASAPTEAAMFGNKYMEDGYTYYFSPEAAQIFSAVLNALSPTTCGAPKRESVSLLVGHANALNMLGL
jgi:hypothetical protein